MKNAILSIFFLAFCAGVQAQMPDNRIDWNPKPLSWADFSGKPDPSNPFSANTSSGISYSWSIKQLGDEVEFVYQVQAYFVPGKSWVKKGKNSGHLLAHEQLHFDITELHARRLRKAMEEFDVRSVKNIKPALQEIYRKIEAEKTEMQKRYDSESQHSMNRKAQLKWQDFVKEELAKLEKFSS